MFKPPSAINWAESVHLILIFTLKETLNSDLEDARHYVQLAALWLARLHNSRLQITPQEEFIEREEKHLHKYVSHFEECLHPHTRRARELMNAIYEAEARLFRERPDLLVQGHGDYHPKNIYIVQGNVAGPESLYVAAIDFDSSYRLPPAYDVGTFLAQFRNQLFGFPEVLENIPEEVFLNSYIEAANEITPDFGRQVDLFRARTNLSIANYLIKLGLGDSENLYRVLVEAENAMAQFSAWRLETVLH
jgi:thiamine kinase-like enzyme